MKVLAVGSHRRKSVNGMKGGYVRVGRCEVVVSQLPGRRVLFDLALPFGSSGYHTVSMESWRRPWRLRRPLRPSA